MNDEFLKQNEITEKCVKIYQMILIETDKRVFYGLG